MVENRKILYSSVFNAPQGVTPSEFCAGKSRMIGLPYSEKNCDNMLSRFRLISERYEQTDRIAISISRVSVLTRDKKLCSIRWSATVVQGHSRSSKLEPTESM